MFTGLIKEQGQISKIIKGSQTIKLTIRASKKLLETYKIGDSMAVNGVCLTCVAKTADSFTVDIMPETFRRTTFVSSKINDKVNLEPAMSVSDRFEGHIVSGHADNVAPLKSKKADKNAIVLTFESQLGAQGLIVGQGSVTLNGVSLTVTHADDHSFSVSLIPHTAKETNLAYLKSGDKVNLEIDVLAKYMQAQLKSMNK